MGIAVPLTMFFLMTGGAVSAPPVFDMVDIEGGRAPSDFPLDDVMLGLDALGNCCLCDVSPPKPGLRIKGTGLVDFDGERSTKAAGHHEAMMPEERLEQLVDLFYRNRFSQVSEKQQHLVSSMESGRVMLGYTMASGGTEYWVRFEIGEAYSRVGTSTTGAPALSTESWTSS